MVEEKKDLEKEIGMLKWKQPGRIDVLLILLYVFSWYLFNDMFNLISIEGLSASGHFFNGVDILAGVPLFIAFLVMISVMLTFVVRSTFDNESHKMINTIVGIWMFFGSLLMTIALVLMLEKFGPSYNVTWLLNLSRNSIYHLGVFLFQIPGVIYFALFK